MKQRLTFILGAFTALLLAAGAAWAAMPATVDSASIIEVADAGTVTIDRVGSTLRIEDVGPATGWTHEIQLASGREVEVDLRNGNRRIQFDAELEDGEIRARIRERVQARANPTTSSADESTSTTVDDSTSTTEDDSPSTSMAEGTTSTSVDDTTSTTLGDTTSTTVDDNDDASAPGSASYAVGSVATVTIAWSDGQMTLVSVSVTDGWSIDEQDLRSDRIEIDFENGDREAEFRADFHHGAVRVETKTD
jgi:hypothetical protein